MKIFVLLNYVQVNPLSTDSAVLSVYGTVVLEGS